MYRTSLCYHPQGAATLYELSTKVLKIIPFASLEEQNQSLFKFASGEESVVVTSETIFHPQGGGQPSDTGVMRMQTKDSTIEVSAVRYDLIDKGRVLHLGQFTTESKFAEGDEVKQSIDVGKRLYYSKLHTAGHILGLAVRDLLGKEIPNFSEGKASHFPDSASCDFGGSIEGKYKAAIQAKVDEYCARALPVEVDWWEEKDFVENSEEAPDASFLLPGDTKFRVIKIVGGGAYPCGGTHVADTSKCGKITVRKISRSKGTSRVSYSVEE
ncbi:hypothetical protein TWF481_000791 [Arthrobotrys musiformis]|uniref:Alanyl-transfer RNA synthetases family profile domain-containing protein n=1 Tax=Arthrobotrys musiformis TaxID=47236 RepID=A0AAV9WQN4_9PEZI